MERIIWLFAIVFFILLIPSAQQTSVSCDNCRQFSNCRLPNCSCCGNSIPGEKSKRPQIVYFSFDDAVTVRNYPLYVELFNGTRLNPNGCPISMTLFVSHNNTDYHLVKNLYKKGMDIAVHGINHIKAKSIQQFTTEALGQRHNLATKANIPKNEIIGYRSPYLIVYGSEHFEILQKAGLKYDSTLTITKRSLIEESPFPFTLDEGWPYPCSIPQCPTRPIPGFWELPVVSVIDRLGQYPCVYVDGCINEPLTEEESYNFLLNNFMSYYNKNKAPFGLNMHSTWLLREYDTDPYRMRAMHRFLDYILSLNDVYVVNMKQTMEWMKQQPFLNQLSSFLPFQCNHTNASFTIASDVPREESQDLGMIQKNFHVPVLRSNFDPVGFGEDLQQRLTKPMSLFLSLGKNADIKTAATLHDKVSLNRKQELIEQDSIRDVKKGIRRKRSTDNDMIVKKSGTFNSETEMVKDSKPKLTKFQKKKNSQNNINSQKDKSTQNPGNVFRLMAKLRIVNITEKSVKIPTGLDRRGSNDVIVVHPVQFSEDQILVDPQKVHSDKSGRVVLIQNKESARSLLNNMPKISIHQSGSEASYRKFNRPFRNPSKTQNIIDPFAANLSMAPVFAPLEHSQLFSLNTKSSYPSMVRSKTYSADGLEKSLGISHTFTDEIIPAVNRTSSRDCKKVNCHLPNCQCQDFTTSLIPSQIPQFVYFTYEGSVNESIAQKLMRLFTPQRTNWDGCRIKGTVFVTSENSNYTSIKKLYDQGFEIGLHGLKKKSLASKLHSLEVAVQKYLLNRYARIPEKDIKGWRSSGLQSKGDDQFISLQKSKLLYDASLFVMTNLDNRTGMWPFTLDFGWQHNCMLQECPTKTYRGLWEVPAVPYVGIKKRYLCKFVDSCYNQPRMSVQTYDFLLDNFMGIYKGDRKPFGVRIRSDWLQPGYEENLKGLDAFLELLQELADVYVVSIHNLIKWMKDPVPHLEGEPTPEARKISC